MHGPYRCILALGSRQYGRGLIRPSISVQIGRKKSVHMTETPPLVQRAIELAARTGFEKSCTPETGRLLRVLAAQCIDGSAGEMGTGCGVGAAWIVSGLPAGSQFVTIEQDRQRVAAVAELFAGYPNVRVLAGDWHDILAHGPFSLLFCDGGSGKRDEPETVLEALAPGGLLLLDDLTPEELWPPEWQGKPDLVREFWLTHPRVAATVIAVNPDMQALLATRLT